MTRIVAGSRGGRRLTAPPGQATRPTSDRVREALFSTLESMTTIEGSRFADVYAGSGAVGLEAASRGASAVLLVENDQRAGRVIRANIASLDLAQVCRLRISTVHSAVTTVGEEPFDVVFADPPYSVTDREINQFLAELVEHSWLASGGIVVIERSSRSPEPEWPRYVTPERSKRYGESMLWYGRRA